MESLIIVVSAILIYYLFVTVIVKFVSERKLGKLNKNSKSEETESGKEQ